MQPPTRTARTPSCGCARGARERARARRRLRRGASSIARQGLELADQLPDLLGEIAGGAREFEPEPREMRELLRLSFRAEDVLVVQFDDDQLDESDEPRSVLRDSVARLQAEGEVEGAAPAVRLAGLGGTHVTPLTRDVFCRPRRCRSTRRPPRRSFVIEAPRRSFLRDVDVGVGQARATRAE